MFGRFGYSDDGNGFRHFLSKKRFPYTDPSGRREALAKCSADFDTEAAKIDDILGRAATSAELRNGLTRVDQRSEREKRDARRRREAELNRQPADDRSSAEQALARLVAERESEAEAKLSPRDRQILRLQRQVDAEKATQAEADARAAALGTPAAVKLLSDLDLILTHAKYDSTVSQSDWEELQHQHSLLLKFGDVRAVSANVETIRTAIVTGAAAQADQLRSSADKIASRVSALKTPEPPLLAGRGDVRTLIS